MGELSWKVLPASQEESSARKQVGGTFTWNFYLPELQGKTFPCRLSHLGSGIALATNFIPVFPDDLTENPNELFWPSQHFVTALGAD